MPTTHLTLIVPPRFDWCLISPASRLNALILPLFPFQFRSAAGPRASRHRCPFYISHVALNFSMESATTTRPAAHAHTQRHTGRNDWMLHRNREKLSSTQAGLGSGPRFWCKNFAPLKAPLNAPLKAPLAYYENGPFLLPQIHS